MADTCDSCGQALPDETEEVEETEQREPETSSQTMNRLLRQASNPGPHAYGSLKPPRPPSKPAA